MDFRSDSIVTKYKESIFVDSIEYIAGDNLDEAFETAKAIVNELKLWNNGEVWELTGESTIEQDGREVYVDGSIWFMFDSEDEAMSIVDGLTVLQVIDY